MNKINEVIRKSVPAKDIASLDIYNPTIAEKAKPGQFVVVRAFKNSERIPLTIADNDAAAGTINLTILKSGKSTHILCELQAGDTIHDVAGPLGKNTEIENFGTVAIIGGGVGIAPTLPIIKAMKKAGNHLITVFGARSKDGLIFEEKAEKYSDEFYICTDDGSKGYKGFVSDFFSDYLLKNPAKKINRVIAIGPALMMKAVSDVTKTALIKTIVSLNPIMVDGTGMCGSCRVEVAGKTKFACVDGPEFDGHEVDFKLLINRLNIYCEEEKISLEKYRESRKCRMDS
ncbi:MAG: Dihydroorotate dehydrogenase B (NAD(+)), electron transfer subunit [Actinobacteria bacterium ADurb.Bin346]|nr:MAG: Dihydroorotate dehydrogenase B (NAD(+)), electron transfer subunit [Actinobacteria bacterium ADurb.Bin346]